MKNWQMCLLIAHAWLIAATFTPTPIGKALALGIGLLFLIWSMVSGWRDGK